MPQTFVLPRQTALDEDASPMAGALAYFFRSGTTELQPIYADIELTTPLENPLPADSAGRFPKAYLDPTAPSNYRVRITSASGVQIYQEDDIATTATEIGSTLYPRTDAEITAGVTPSALAVPNDSTGVVFEERYASAADAALVAAEATLQAVYTGGFYTGVLAPGSISQFYARESITDHAHYGFLDDSLITYAGGAPSYGHASFDDNVTFSGSVASDHHHSFQSYPHYGTAATITRIAGFYSIGDVTAGTVTSYAGLYVDDPTGAGTITNMYGVYIAPLDRGTGNSYAFFSEGQTKSCLGGDLQLGNPVTPATVKYNYDNGNLEILPRATYKVHVQSALLLGTTAEGTAAKIENTTGGDLEITARSGFNIKAMSPTQVSHPLKLPAYTVAQLGSSVLPASWTDCICICSNETGGRVPVFSDGTNWRRVTDRAVAS